MFQSTIADSLGPQFLKELSDANLLPSVSEGDMTDIEDDIFDDYIRQTVGLTTGEHLWDALWRFGIILDDDAAKVVNLGSFWRPERTLDTRYYVPDDLDTEISIDHPPSVDVAWDAK
jgi:hypothetical protein